MVQFLLTRQQLHCIQIQLWNHETNKDCSWNRNPCHGSEYTSTIINERTQLFYGGSTNSIGQRGDHIQLKQYILCAKIKFPPLVNITPSSLPSHPLLKRGEFPSERDDGLLSCKSSDDSD